MFYTGTLQQTAVTHDKFIFKSYTLCLNYKIHKKKKKRNPILIHQKGQHSLLSVHTHEMSYWMYMNMKWTAGAGIEPKPPLLSGSVSAF